MRRLSLRQQKFVDGYLRSGNATQAAIEAGYSPKTARSIASENLTKASIKAALRARQSEQVEEMQTTYREYLEHLGRICDAKIDSVYDENNRVRHPKYWDPEVYLIIEDFKVRKRKNGQLSTEVTFIDRHKYLEMLGNAVGAFVRTRYKKRKR